MTLTASSVLRPTEGASTDWAIALVPTAIAVRVLSAPASLALVGMLTAVVFIRRTRRNYPISPGPLIALLGASVIVLSRPQHMSSLLLFVMVFAFVLRIIARVRAPLIISSIIDGCGIYSAANVLCYVFGIQSPSAQFRIGGLEESTGFVRTIFPLTWSINAPSIVAAVYVASFLILLRTANGRQRVLRTLSAIPSGYIIIASGNRVAFAVAFAVPIVIVIFPFALRWMAQVSTIFAAISSFYWEKIAASILFFITPLAAASSVLRDHSDATTSSLNGRNFIWTRTIEYWWNNVNDLPHILFGYGVSGQLLSGASSTYRNWIIGIVSNPDLALVHNSYLQQLFDGGVVGLFLLVGASFWSSYRLAKNVRRSANLGICAIAAMTILQITAITEAFMAPGVALESFWLLIFLIGLACQISHPCNIPEVVHPETALAVGTTGLPKH